MRTVVGILCALALAGAFVPAVSAGQPERESAKGTTAFYDFPAGTVCPFEATVDFYKSEGTYFTFDNGVFKIAYTFWIRFTNVDTGNTRILHEAGNVVTTPLSSDITATRTDGRELSAFSPGVLGPGAPGAFIFIVGSSLEIDQTPGPNPDPIFGYTTLSFQILSGYAENLCQTMA
jgi:hypothetical protein